MKYLKKYMVIILAIILINTSIISILSDENSDIIEKDGKNFKKKNIIQSSTDYCLYSDTNLKNNLIDNDIEMIIFNFNETIQLHESGKVDISLTAKPDSPLASDLYMQVFDVPAMNEYNTSLQFEDKIIVTQGLDSFSESIAKEHLMMMGLSIDQTQRAKIQNSLDEIRIDFAGEGLSKTSIINNNIRNVEFGPLAIGDSDIFHDYVCMKIGFQKLMMATLDGEQMFKSTWISTIKLPDNSHFYNMDELESSHWCLDFGGGTYLETYIDEINDTAFKLIEILSITENETLNPAPLNKYKTFNIKYFTESKAIINNQSKFITESEGFQSSNIFQWGTSIQFGKNGIIDNQVLPLIIEYDYNYTVSFNVLVTTEQANISGSLDLSANFTMNFTDEYKYDTGWENIVMPYEWCVFGLIGPIPIWFDIELAPQYRIETEIDAGSGISFGAWVQADLNMGAIYTYQEGFDIIWDKNFDYGFYEPQVTIENLIIKPSVSVIIKAKLYSVIGPCVRPIIYFQCIVNYIDNELFWRIKSGLNLKVGVCVGIPFFSDVCWEWTIYEFMIKEWKNYDESDGVDTFAPITKIHCYPQSKYGWTGKKIWIWFNTTDVADEDEIPIGIKKTEYDIAGAGWNEYDYSNLSRIKVPDVGDQYQIKYSSTDRLFNEEEIKIANFNLDKYPPNSKVHVGSPSNIDEVNKSKPSIVYSYHTPIVLDAEDGATGWEIWYRIKDINGDYSSWKKGDFEKEITYHFTTLDEGIYTIEYFAMDGVWNNESINTKEFFVKTNINNVNEISLYIHKISQIDDFDKFIIPFLFNDQCDWYYYVGYSEDNGNTFYWQMSDGFPIQENKDNLIVDKMHTFYTHKDEVTVNIMVCEKDDFVWDGDHKDDIADIFSYESDGKEVNYDNRIYPPSTGFEYYGSCNFNYSLPTDKLHGGIFKTSGGWIKTSGDYDNIDSHKWDASVLFEINNDHYNTKPTANFSYEPQEPTINDIIQFTDLSSDPDGDITNWIWDFGDGNLSYERNPNHRYLKNGSYNVSLLVYDNYNAIDISSKTIMVSKPCVYINDDYNSSTPGWQIDHFNNIQDGIDAVDENGIVHVYNGTYYENIAVNKTIDLIGENKYSTIIDGEGNNDVVFISSDYVNISDFYIRNSGNWGGWSDGDSGIDSISSHVKITNCKFDNNHFGIWMREGDSNELSYCQFDDNDQAIILRCSIFNCYIKDCEINNCGQAIRLGSNSDDHVIENCVISNGDSKGAIDLCSGCDNEIIRNCTFYNNINGIRFEGSGSNSYITNCSFVNNDYGITSTSWANFFDNHIYHNNFFNNTVNAFDNGNNIWDNGYPSGGNYWDDYSGLDANDDGIGDTPYYIIGGGNQDNYPLMYHSGDEEPVAEANGPYTGRVNESITVDATGSYDPNGIIIGYRWDWTDDGIYDTPWITSPTTTHTYSNTGTYTIKLQVKDNDGLTDTDTTKVQITDYKQPPIAEANGPYIGTVNESITFDATGSYDPDGIIIGYRWDWSNDGIWDTGWLSEPITTHTYKQPGLFTVKLEVKDNDKLTNNDTASVNISELELSPHADAGGPYYGNIGKQIYFDASDSYDIDGNIIGFRWDWTNDGTYDTPWITSPTTTHTYSNTGTYTVKLEVKDNDGLNDTDTAYVTITDYQQPPIADANGPYTGRENESITFDATGSYDPDGTIAGYRWDWSNDGIYDTPWITSPTTTHTYSNTGTYTIKLQVKDNDGLTDTDTTTVTITGFINHPPTKPIVSGDFEYIVNEEAMVQFLSYDIDNDKIRYHIDWGDGNSNITAFYNSGETITVSYKWENQGEYTVRVYAIDEHNASSPYSTIIVNVKEKEMLLISEPGGPYYGMIGDTILFDGSMSSCSYGEISEYKWIFDDLTVEYGVNTFHVFKNSGIHTIGLYVEDEYGYGVMKTTSVHILD